MSTDDADIHNILSLREIALGKASQLGLYPWEEAINEPVPDWLVPGLLQQEAIHVLSADSGTCKSWLGLSLALSGLYGFPVLGQAPARPFSSIYLAADSPKWDIGQQLRKLRNAHQLASTSPYDDTHMFVMPIGFLLNNPEHVNQLAQVVRYWDIQALFIDVMLYVHDGDENDNSFMARAVYRAAKFLRDQLKLAVYFLHHNSKPKDGEPAGFRGAGTIIQAAEHHFTLSRRKEDILLRPKKIRGDAILPEQLAFTLAMENNGRCLRLQTTTLTNSLSAPSTCATTPTPADGNGPPTSSALPLPEQILQVLRIAEVALSRQALMTALSVTPSAAGKLDNSLQRLRRSGLIQSTPAGWLLVPSSASPTSSST